MLKGEAEFDAGNEEGSGFDSTKPWQGAPPDVVYNAGIPPDSRGTLKGYEWLRERLADPAKIAVARRLAPIAAELDCTLAQMALAWCLKNPHVSTVITGATRPAQVVENMRRSPSPRSSFRT
jgi:aryl-alcohol dehydrogenase-like predicted oxidoreductase